MNPQHRDFRHMWRCNICGNKGHGLVRFPFCDSCQLAVVLGKSQVEVKKTFGKRVLEEMRTRLKAGIPGNKIVRGDFKWERALEIVSHGIYCEVQPGTVELRRVKVRQKEMRNQGWK